jgi:MFS superfamily sulfate permease-like transporter
MHGRAIVRECCARGRACSHLCTLAVLPSIAFLDVPANPYGFFSNGGRQWAMYTRLDRTHRFIPVALGAVTIAGVGVLMVWDAFPTLFPARSHDSIAAFPLATISFAYLVYQIAHRPPWKELAKAIMLSAAFLFWAANQLWPDLRQATLFNDIAIALFVLDVFLVIIGWPATSPDESFGETQVDSRD